jgi:signal peptidase I
LDTPDLRDRRREARKLARDIGRILKRRGHRLAPSTRKGLEARVAEVQKWIGEDLKGDRLESAARALRDDFAKHHAVLRRATPLEYVQSLGLAVAVALLIRAFLIEAFKIPTGSMIPTLQVGDHIFVNKFSYGLRIPFTHTRIVDFGGPERGDIVVFEFPGEGEDKGKDFIKRVVAVAGDRIRLQDNRLLVNGTPIAVEVTDSSAPCEDATFTGCRCVRQEETLGSTRFVTQHLAPAETGGCINNPEWPSEDPRQYGNPASNPSFPDVVVPEGHVFAMGDNRDNSSDGRYWGFVPIENLKGKALFVWWPPGRWFRAVH